MRPFRPPLRLCAPAQFGKGDLLFFIAIEPDGRRPLARVDGCDGPLEVPSLPPGFRLDRSTGGVISKVALDAWAEWLDVAIGTDHATYAEAFRDDVPYSATASPTRRELLSRWQRVNASGADGAAGAADFDLDPHPVNGARDGTWNPGVLLARASLNP